MSYVWLVTLVALLAGGSFGGILFGGTEIIEVEVPGETIEVEVTGETVYNNVPVDSEE